MGIMFLLFTSGIFWDARALATPEMAEWVLTLNPLAFIIDAYRQVLMVGVSPDLVHLGVVAAFTCVVIALMLYLLRSQSQYLALRAITS